MRFKRELLKETNQFNSKQSDSHGIPEWEQM